MCVLQITREWADIDIIVANSRSGGQWLPYGSNWSISDYANNNANVIALLFLELEYLLMGYQCFIWYRGHYCLPYCFTLVIKKKWTGRPTTCPFRASYSLFIWDDYSQSSCFKTLKLTLPIKWVMKAVSFTDFYRSKFHYTGWKHGRFQTAWFKE